MSRCYLGPVVLFLWMSHLTAVAEPSTSPPEPVGELNEPRVCPVSFAKDWIGKRVKTVAGDTVGAIEDVAIDIGKGEVQSVFLQPPPPAKKPREILAIPGKSLAFNTEQNELARAEFYIDKLPPPQTEIESRPNSPGNLILLAKIEPIAVLDKNGVELGKISDFALAADRLTVAYAVFLPANPTKELAKHEFYPIPLSAFLFDSKKNRWILDLAPQVLLNTAVANTQHPPAKVDSLWTEFVHVRYGRTILGGVQDSTQQEQKSP
ncbi:MAG: PRC-barrel domain-containing protein [Pirellulales bacterium]|nr:PRC-barrel domain-containing protein [Pirellulales bacterium]